MAEQARDGNWAKPKRAFTMRALWRLAIWGTAAAASLLVVVLAGYSETGSQRVMAARASPGGTLPALPNAAQLARAVDIETRRLAGAVNTLTADRDRLAARLATLELSLEDVTGSIKRQAGVSNAGAPPPSPVPPIPAGAAPATPAPPKEAAVPPAPEPSIPARPPAPAAEPQPGAPERVAPPAAAAEDSGSEPAATKAELGVEIGGAASLEGVRALWTSTKNANAGLFEGLHPIVAVRENSRTKAVELRLIAGPLAAEAAERLCATLTGKRRYCQPAAFEGQRLAQADQPPERKPAPRSAPAPASRSIWPFR